MSKKDDGEESVNIRTILWIIAAVLIWVGLQSFTGVPMKM
jgi:hypothetical protein